MEQLELWSAAHSVEPPSTAEVEAHPAEVIVRERNHLNSLAFMYVKSSRAERTRVSYETDWRLFERWCGEHDESALPASFATLARYMTHLAQSGRKASTIRRARTSIGVLHGQRGLPRPDRDDRIRTLERGIGRVHGNREEGAKPLLVPELERMMMALSDSLRDARDRALLLLGFAGAFRASELVGLDVGDLELRTDGLRVQVRRSKTDQLGRGTRTDVPRAQNPALCAVGALERWLQRLEGPGPLFRLVYGPRISQDRLAPRAVTRALQRAAKRAGVVDEYSSHSLRSGLATSAHAQGRSPRDIQVHGRWKDLRSLDRYIDVSAAAARAVVVGLL